MALGEWKKSWLKGSRSDFDHIGTAIRLNKEEKVNPSVCLNRYKGKILPIHYPVRYFKLTH